MEGMHVEYSAVWRLEMRSPMERDEMRGEELLGLSSI